MKKHVYCEKPMAHTVYEVLFLADLTKENGLIVKYEYPAREDLPPVSMAWYDEGKRPEIPVERQGVCEKNNGRIFPLTIP